MKPSDLSKWHQRFLPDEAATLAIMRDGPYDVRPGLLLLFLADNLTELPVILRHGALYARAWASAHGIEISGDVAEFAARDGLSVAYRRRAPMPAGERARSLGIRLGTFHRIRNAVIVMYETRLFEAKVRFTAGTIYTRESLQWEIGLSYLRKTSRTVPASAQPIELQAA